MAKTVFIRTMAANRVGCRGGAWFFAFRSVCVRAMALASASRQRLFGEADAA
jgi:hypothetical protein